MSLFQSTLLMRGATDILTFINISSMISIHAPHARSDQTKFDTLDNETQFQSTLLMRGATRFGLIFDMR